MVPYHMIDQRSSTPRADLQHKACAEPAEQPGTAQERFNTTINHGPRSELVLHALKPADSQGRVGKSDELVFHDPPPEITYGVPNSTSKLCERVSAPVIPSN